MPQKVCVVWESDLHDDLRFPTGHATAAYVIVLPKSEGRHGGGGGALTSKMSALPNDVRKGMMKRMARLALATGYRLGESLLGQFSRMSS